ncbi:MAG: oligosaccharide flippase family protein, partial [Pseudomonadota bacterium]
AVTVAAVLGAAVVWLVRDHLAIRLTDDPSLAFEFGILGLGVALTVLFRWRQSLLSGYRAVGNLARAVVLGTVLATIAGLVAVWLLGREGIIWAVVAVPFFSLLMTLRAPLPKVPEQRTRRGLLFMTVAWRRLFRLGFALMLIALLTLAVPMILRVWLIHVGGLAEAGLFQAVWVISAHVMTVLMTSVAMDFYPALSVAASDPGESRRLINLQCRVHLVFGAPVVLAVISLAPVLLILLFSQEFAVAAALLQWQMLALVLRLIAVPAETLLTAQARPWPVFLLHAVVQGATLLLAVHIYSVHGLAGIGIAHVMGGVLHLVLLGLILRQGKGATGQRVVWTWSVLVRAGGLASLSLLLIMGHAISPAAAAVAGCTVTGLAAVPCLLLMFGSLPAQSRLRRSLSAGISKAEAKIARIPASI